MVEDLTSIVIKHFQKHVEGQSGRVNEIIEVSTI